MMNATKGTLTPIETPVAWTPTVANGPDRRAVIGADPAPLAAESAPVSADCRTSVEVDRDL